MVEATVPEATLKHLQGFTTMNMIAQEFQTDNVGGFVPAQVTQEGLDNAVDVNRAQLERNNEHVQDVSKLPFVEFIGIQIEIHPSSPQRPDGPIILQPRFLDDSGSELVQSFSLMEGVWFRFRIDFKVHHNHCIGLKSVTGIKVLEQVLKDEEIYGAYRADPSTVVTAHSQYNQAPEGFIAKIGHFKGLFYYSDVNKLIHLKLNLKMKIKGSWKK